MWCEYDLLTETKLIYTNTCSRLWSYSEVTHEVYKYTVNIHKSVA